MRAVDFDYLKKCSDAELANLQRKKADWGFSKRDRQLIDYFVTVRSIARAIDTIDNLSESEKTARLRAITPDYVSLQKHLHQKIDAMTAVLQQTETAKETAKKTAAENLAKWTSVNSASNFICFAMSTVAAFSEATVFDLGMPPWGIVPALGAAIAFAAHRFSDKHVEKSRALIRRGFSAACAETSEQCGEAMRQLSWLAKAGKGLLPYRELTPIRAPANNRAIGP